MNRTELVQLLEAGAEVGLLRGVRQYAPGVSADQVVTLCRATPDSSEVFSLRALDEMPRYAAEQKAIKGKPLKVCLLTLSEDFSICEMVNIHFAALDEVDLFLRQFDKTLDDFNELSDAKAD
jgi:hypothetical protein